MTVRVRIETNNEKNISAIEPGQETPPRLSCAHGHRWRTPGFEGPPGQGTQAPVGLRITPDTAHV